MVNNNAFLVGCIMMPVSSFMIVHSLSNLVFRKLSSHEASAFRNLVIPYLLFRLAVAVSIPHLYHSNFHLFQSIFFFSIAGAVKSWNVISRFRLDAHFRRSEASVPLTLVLSPLFVIFCIAWYYRVLLVECHMSLSVMSIFAFDGAALALDTIPILLAAVFRIPIGSTPSVESADTEYVRDSGSHAVRYSHYVKLLRNADFWMEKLKYVLYIFHCFNIWLLKGVSLSILDLLMIVSLKAIVSQIAADFRAVKRERLLRQQLDSCFEKVYYGEKDDSTECAICRERILDGQKLPCNHAFHARCIYLWLTRSQTCPICRQTVPLTTSQVFLTGQRS
eukprot:ANDGO_05874.mRNA.1 E3 ubiquitin protein ligase RIN3